MNEQRNVSVESAPSSIVYKFIVVGVMFLVFVSAYLDRQIIGLLIPSLKAALGLSDTQIGLLQGLAFAGVFVFAGLFIGRLVDRSNRRNIIIAGLTIWSAATIACGFADQFVHLFIARIFVGIGEACIAPAAISFMADCFPAHQRGRAMGLAQLGGPVGSALALVSGGFLLHAYAGNHGSAIFPSDWEGWRVVFVAAGVPGLLIAPIVALLREPDRGDRRPASAAAPGGGFAVVRSLGRVFIVFAVVFALANLVVYAITSWGPTLLMRVYHLKPAVAGSVYGGIVLSCAIAGAAMGGFLSDALARWRPADGRVLIPLMLLPVEITAWIIIANTHNVSVLVPALGLSALCNTMISGSAYVALQEIVPNEMRGQAISVFLLVTNLVGIGLGPMTVAFVTDTFFRDEMMLQSSLVIVVLSGTTTALASACLLPRLYRRSRTLLS